MSILQRYVLKEMLGPLGLGLLVFTSVFLIGQMFQLADLLLNSGVSGKLVGELILSLLPGILSLTIPMAVLVSILLGVGRLSADREILAIRMSGINLIHICIPILGLAGLLSASMTVANFQVIPYLNLKSADLRTQIEFNVLSALPAGIPINLPGDEKSGATTLFFDRKDPATGKMLDVCMRTQLPQKSENGDQGGLLPGGSRPARDQKTTSSAAAKSKDSRNDKAEKERQDRRRNWLSRTSDTSRSAELLRIEENRDIQEVLVTAAVADVDPNIKERVLTFRLTSGSMHVLNNQDGANYSIIYFDKLSKGYVPKLEKTDEGVYKKNAREMSIPELIARASTTAKAGKYLVELYQRFSIPLACLAFALIAIPLAVYARPTGKAVAFAISFLLILLYYGLLNYGIALGRSGGAGSAIAIFFPNVLLASVGACLLYRMVMR